jgi:hypothetical protein
MIALLRLKNGEETVEKFQKQQHYYTRNESSNADTIPVFRGVHEAEEIVPGVPIIRSNTPRPSALDATISSTGYRHQRGGPPEIEAGKGEFPFDFPVQAPSAPPLPEELENDVRATARRQRGGDKPHCSEVPLPESQNQIVGLSFADVPSQTGSVGAGQAQGTFPTRLSVGAEQAQGTFPTCLSVGAGQAQGTFPTRLSLGAGQAQGTVPTGLSGDRREESCTPPSSHRSGDKPQSFGVVPPVEQDEKLSPTQACSHHWLIAFSLYLVGVLFILLLLAVVQGIGIMPGTLESGFAPLGVPWQVLVCGLLGGCISCVVSLGNIATFDPPLFIMITWFTRPFIGSLLALFSYILLTSGIFTLGGSADRHPSFFWLIGIFAGLCEWWLFCRRKGSNA